MRLKTSPKKTPTTTSLNNDFNIHDITSPPFSPPSRPPTSQQVFDNPAKAFSNIIKAVILVLVSLCQLAPGYAIGYLSNFINNLASASTTTTTAGNVATATVIGFDYYLVSNWLSILMILVPIFVGLNIQNNTCDTDTTNHNNNHNNKHNSNSYSGNGNSGSYSPRNQKIHSNTKYTSRISRLKYSIMNKTTGIISIGCALLVLTQCLGSLGMAIGYSTMKSTSIISQEDSQGMAISRNSGSTKLTTAGFMMLSFGISGLSIILEWILLEWFRGQTFSLAIGVFFAFHHLAVILGKKTSASGNNTLNTSSTTSFPIVQEVVFGWILFIFSLITLGCLWLYKILAHRYPPKSSYTPRYIFSHNRTASNLNIFGSLESTATTTDHRSSRNVRGLGNNRGLSNVAAATTRSHSRRYGNNTTGAAVSTTNTVNNYSGSINNASVTFSTTNTLDGYADNGATAVVSPSYLANLKNGGTKKSIRNKPSIKDTFCPTETSPGSPANAVGGSRSHISINGGGGGNMDLSDDEVSLVDIQISTTKNEIPSLFGTESESDNNISDIADGCRATSPPIPLSRLLQVPSQQSPHSHNCGQSNDDSNHCQPKTKAKNNSKRNTMVTLNYSAGGDDINRHSVIKMDHQLESEKSSHPNSARLYDWRGNLGIGNHTNNSKNSNGKSNSTNKGSPTLKPTIRFSHGLPTRIFSWSKTLASPPPCSLMVTTSPNNNYSKKINKHSNKSMFARFISKSKRPDKIFLRTIKSIEEMSHHLAKTFWVLVALLLLLGVSTSLVSNQSTIAAITRLNMTSSDGNNQIWLYLPEIVQLFTCLLTGLWTYRFAHRTSVLLVASLFICSGNLITLVYQNNSSKSDDTTEMSDSDSSFGVVGIVSPILIAAGKSIGITTIFSTLPLVLTDSAQRGLALTLFNVWSNLGPLISNLSFNIYLATTATIGSLHSQNGSRSSSSSSSSSWLTKVSSILQPSSESSTPKPTLLLINVVAIFSIVFIISNVVQFILLHCNWMTSLRLINRPKARVDHGIASSSLIGWQGTGLMSISNNPSLLLPTIVPTLWRYVFLVTTGIFAIGFVVLFIISICINHS